MQRRNLLGIALEAEREGFGQGFAGEIVLSGTKAAHQDHDVGAAQRIPDGVDQIFLAVADNGFESHRHAELVELLGEVEGVGVLAERRQHLRADCDDLRFHESSYQLLAPGL